MGKEKLWGYINRNGEMVIEPKFHSAWNFHEGLAAVAVDWARGYIDLDGNYIIEPKYQYAGPFRDGKAKVMLDDVWEYIDHEGNKVGDAEPEKMVDDSVSSEDPVPTLKGKKFGYTDKDGKFVIKPHFIQAKPFSDERAAVLVEVRIED
ncbi:MAG: WG repeat-containing protein [Muribaculaceae bacterium]|nr:WG repeat-containing protein [Muribaculaceae bacterium]